MTEPIITLVSIVIKNWDLQTNINIWAIVAIACLPLVVRFMQTVVLPLIKKMMPMDFFIDQVSLGTSKGEVIIKPNYMDRQVAYKLWVEINTRKIGLPIDWDNDVVVEVYNSWYEFFRVTRELIKEIPVEKVRANQSTKTILKLSVEVLNEQLRPHLTKWQARFRKWYEMESKKNSNGHVSPQDIQKKFPKFSELKNDMNNVSSEIQEYSKNLEKLIN